MQPEPEALRAKTQHNLIDFLRTELEIGPTFVQSALLAKSDGHMDHYAQAKQNAVIAAESIRSFISEVADTEVRTEIGKRLDELDRLISAL